MYCDFPKQSRTEYVFEKSFLSVKDEEVNNDRVKNPYKDADGFDGITFLVRGTASSTASGMSLSNVQFQIVHFPYSHPLPEYKLAVQKVGENMELAEEVRNV